MKIYQGNNFTVSIPNAWNGTFDDEDEYDVIYSPDGPGEIQVSRVEHEADLSVEDLKAIAAEDIQGGAKVHEVEMGDYIGIVFDYDVDDEYWCEWYLANGSQMLFITYTCPEDEEGRENDDVELILGTLKPSELNSDGNSD